MLRQTNSDMHSLKVHVMRQGQEGAFGKIKNQPQKDHIGGSKS